MCERWSNFKNFLHDMGEPPAGTSIDRWPNNNGDYEPGNCRWATQQQQMRNTRVNVHLHAFGETKCLAEWLEDARCAVGRSCLRRRVANGCPHELAITDPPDIARKKVVKRRDPLTQKRQKLLRLPQPDQGDLFPEKRCEC